jgi:hypothetical protein
MCQRLKICINLAKMHGYYIINKVPSVAGACYGGVIGATKVLGPVRSVGLMWNLFMGASAARRKEEGQGYFESMRSTFKVFSQ